MAGRGSKGENGKAVENIRGGGVRRVHPDVFSRTGGR